MKASTRGKPVIHSYGGGTQSVAISVLVAQGKLPRPERVVIADTGREASSTWSYLDEYVRPLLAGVGLEVEVAPHSLATVDLYSASGDLLIPAFTETGKLPTFCSSEWKKRVVGRYLREQGYGPENPVVEWMGFSLDEVGRCKPSGIAWRDYRWPLIFDAPMRRGECAEVARRAGLPTPPKSSCWMCPFRQNSQWRDLRDNYPEDWQEAVEFDEEIRRNDGRGGVFVHMSAKPLAEADLEERDAPQLALFGDTDDCGSGYCMT